MPRPPPADGVRLGEKVAKNACKYRQLDACVAGERDLVFYDLRGCGRGRQRGRRVLGGRQEKHFQPTFGHQLLMGRVRHDFAGIQRRGGVGPAGAAAGVGRRHNQNVARVATTRKTSLNFSPTVVCHPLLACDSSSSARFSFRDRHGAAGDRALFGTSHPRRVTLVQHITAACRKTRTSTVETGT
ncbi:unnamed protein product [Diplocarpon coronariae]